MSLNADELKAVLQETVGQELFSRIPTDRHHLFADMENSLKPQQQERDNGRVR